MSGLAVPVFAVAVIGFVAVSAWLDRRQISAAMAFVGLGTLLALVLAEGGLRAPSLQALTEATLALVLFHDAAQVRPRELRADAALSGRLLLLGLPLTILMGYALAQILMPAGTSVWLALFLAAALAPTDAGLGAATVLNPVVPARIRRVLNVESGLNDGLATPVVLLAIAGFSEPLDTTESHLVAALEELLIGVGVGAAAGALVGALLVRARRRDLIGQGLEPIAALAVPLLAYYGSVEVGGNGFVAAFVSGTAFAAGHHVAQVRVLDDGLPADGGGGRIGPQTEVRDPNLDLTESLSTVLGFAVWMLFGAVAVPVLWEALSWQAFAFAVLSLTALRMVPVALVLLGTGLRAPSVAFIGWFGPRGLASVVFALIATHAESDSDVSPVIAAIAATVVLSVVLHGVSAGPWARRYGAWAAAQRPPVETAERMSGS